MKARKPFGVFVIVVVVGLFVLVPMLLAQGLNEYGLFTLICVKNNDGTVRVPPEDECDPKKETGRVLVNAGQFLVMAGEIDDLEQEDANLQAQIDALQAALDSEEAARMAADQSLNEAVAAEAQARAAADTALQSQVSAAQATANNAQTTAENAQTTANNAQATANAAQAAADAAQSDAVALNDLLQHVSRDGDQLRITGANLHIVNGTGSTNGAPNALGNLIIGYNESRGDPAEDDRSGSHMLVIGSFNNYRRFGGMVVGIRNYASGDYASVSGGYRNTAGGFASSISGGANAYVSGYYNWLAGSLFEPN